MPRFEYHEAEIELDKRVEECNKLGAEGWEIVHIMMKQKLAQKVDLRNGKLIHLPPEPTGLPVWDALFKRTVDDNFVYYPGKAVQKEEIVGE